MDDGSRVEDYLHRMPTIDGWFGPLDAHVMLALAAAQTRSGITGDLLEIGVFAGRSAMLLGFAPAAGERLHVCDPFDTLTVGETTISESHAPPSREAFEARYRREHGALPEIHQCRSTELAGRLEPGSFRFVHVDGGHRYEDARADLDLSLELLGSGGVVCFDDYRTLITPGVALAVWEAVAAGRLTVVALTGSKCYCVARGDRAAAALQAVLRDDPRFDGEDYDLDDDVPARGVWLAGGVPDPLTGELGVASRRRPEGRSFVAAVGTEVLDRLPDALSGRIRAVRYRLQARRRR